MLLRAIDVVIQRWTFSRLRESSVAHVGKRELSPMSRLRRNHDTSCLETGHLASNVLVAKLSLDILYMKTRRYAV